MLSSEDQTPPTVIVVHPRERAQQVLRGTMRGRADICFFTFPETVTVPLHNYIRLGMDGETLSEADMSSGLLILDGTWRLAQRMERPFQQLPVRTLPPIRTAYPRKSKVFADPTDGLATIEALYAALRIMKRPVDGLLDCYHWKDEFLKLNGWSEP